MTSSLAEKQTIDSQCVLGAKPPLIEGVSDYTLSLVIPIVTHWLTSAFYEVLERFNLLQKYKIHSNAEETAKNPISRVECLRGVLLVQVSCSLCPLAMAHLIFKIQVLQTGLGIVLGYLSDEEIICNDDKDVMIWANRVHGAGKMTLTLLSYCGLDAAALSAVCLSALRTASMLSGQTELDLEWLVAKIIYHGLMPALRFYSALWLADAWVFFIHRAEHSSPWLYRTLNDVFIEGATS
jgi:sphinganine C4-monooxygenase